MASRGRITITLMIVLTLLTISGCASSPARQHASKDHRDFQNAIDQGDYNSMNLLLRKNPRLTKQFYRPRAGTTFPGKKTRFSLYDAPVCLAAFYGDVEMMKLLIAHGAALSHRDHSTLYVAATLGHTDIVRLLITENADVDERIKTKAGATALHTAAAKGHKDIVEILIAEGAEVNARDDTDSTPTYYASVGGRGDVVDVLREHGGTIGAEIYEAVDRSDLEKVGSLLDRQPKLIATREFGWKWTPLFWAVKNGDMEIAKYLVNAGADVDAENKNGLTLLQVAYVHNHKDMIDLLRKAGATLGIEIHEAAEQGDLTKVKHILGKDPAAIGTTDVLNWTPLFWSVEGKQLELIELLIKWEANVNVKDKHARTPLLRAAKRGDSEIVKLLLDAGADANAKNESGNAALHRATYNGNQAVAELLIACGADINAKNDQGSTPLLRAAHGGHDEIVRLLLDEGADLSAKTEAGTTALHWAAYNGDKAVVALLIARGADVNVKTKSGLTPLHHAASMYKALPEHKSTVLFLREHGGTLENAICDATVEGNLHKVESLLKENEKLIHTKDAAFEWTPLHWAAAGGNLDLVQFLLTKGADVEAKDNKNRTALYYAEKYSHKQVADLLRKSSNIQ